MANQGNYTEFFHDMGVFLVWLIFGIMIGWMVAFAAHGKWMVSPYFDYYGIAGGAIAILWASFRRQRHLEHLPHVRKHLEHMSGKKK